MGNTFKKCDQSFLKNVSQKKLNFKMPIPMPIETDDGKKLSKIFLQSSSVADILKELVDRNQKDQSLLKNLIEQSVEILRKHFLEKKMQSGLWNLF